MLKLSKIIGLLFLVTFLTTGLGFSITVDGDYHDWFPNITGFQATDNIARDATGEMDNGISSGIYWAEEDYVGNDTYLKVWPGYGGQSFDHEGLYFTEDMNNYYIGLVSGMSPGANNTYWSTVDHYIGDIAINTGGGFDVAIDMFDIRDNAANPTVRLITGVTSWTDTSPYNPVYNPTPYIANNYTNSIKVDFSYQHWGDSYFYEFGIDKNYFNINRPAMIFATMDCGNDWIQLEVVPSFGIDPVPEPGTIMLFSIGLLCMIGAKFKFKK